MRKRIAPLLAILLVLTAGIGFASDKAPLGTTNLAVKLDYIRFTNGGLEDAHVDKAAYLGLEGYFNILWSHFYLGGEIGYANPDGHPFFGRTELEYLPIEVNGKYAFVLIPNLAADLGGGLSWTHARFKVSDAFFPEDSEDWLFGTQLFADLNYSFGHFFAGANLKYQVTQEFSRYDFGVSNWRMGGQVGVRF